jgi:hypothetical protein
MKEDDGAKFWERFEAETGERVAAKTIGTFYERGGDERGLWGLLVVTDASFRFKHFPSDNMVLGLFKVKGRSEPEAPVDIAVPLSSVSALKEEERGFWKRIFGSAFPRFELAWREGEAVRSESFAVDPSSDVMRLLREAAAAAH